MSGIEYADTSIFAGYRSSTSDMVRSAAVEQHRVRHDQDVQDVVDNVA